MRPLNSELLKEKINEYFNYIKTIYLNEFSKYLQENTKQFIKESEDIFHFEEDLTFRVTNQKKIIFHLDLKTFVEENNLTDENNLKDISENGKSYISYLIENQENVYEVIKLKILKEIIYYFCQGNPDVITIGTIDSLTEYLGDKYKLPYEKWIPSKEKEVSNYLKMENKKVFVIHRLDYDTSGVIMFAKNQKVQKLYQDNWNNLAKKREYTATVEGITNSKGHIESYLKMSKTLQVYSSKNKDGLLAITDYERIKYNNKYSLVKILISTGRRNQIRCHMADIGHPILGDNRYAKKKNDPLGRLALHANRLEIINPISNKLMIFTSEIPKEFYDIVK